MFAALAIIFAALLLAGALWLPWWALLPAGALIGWLLPGAVGVIFGLMRSVAAQWSIPDLAPTEPLKKRAASKPPTSPY